MTIKKAVWFGADNRFKLLLGSKNEYGGITAVDLSNVVRMDFQIDGHLLTVAVNQLDAEIDWWSDGLAKGEVEFQLGVWAESEAIAEGEYIAELMSVDGIDTNGIIWSSDVRRELMIWVSYSVPGAVEPVPPVDPPDTLSGFDTGYDGGYS